MKILQFHPGYIYLDRADKLTYDKKIIAQESDEEEEQVKQVNVTFARLLPKFCGKSQKQSYQIFIKKVFRR